MGLLGALASDLLDDEIEVISLEPVAETYKSRDGTREKKRKQAFLAFPETTNSNFRPIEKPDFEINHERVNLKAARKIRQDILRAEGAPHNKDLECTVKVLTVEDKTRVVNPDRKFPSRLAEILETGDTELVVKIALSKEKAFLVSVAREIAIMRQLAETRKKDGELFFPDFIEPAEDDFSNPACVQQTLISENVGQGNLRCKVRKVRDVYLVGAKLLRAIKQIHALGVVHGDLHFGNIIANDLESLRVIDFGEAQLFVTDEGNHVPDHRGNNNVIHMNMGVGTPWELLDKSPRTRRDDFYRIAFMLHVLVNTNIESARQSRNPCLEVANPAFPVLDAMFQTACAMTFAQKPDYDLWIEKLEGMAKDSAADAWTPREKVTKIGLPPIAAGAKGSNPFAKKNTQPVVQKNTEVAQVEIIGPKLMRRGVETDQESVLPPQSVSGTSSQQSDPDPNQFCIVQGFALIEPCLDECLDIQVSPVCPSRPRSRTASRVEDSFSSGRESPSVHINQLLETAALVAQEISTEPIECDMEKVYVYSKPKQKYIKVSFVETDAEDIRGSEAEIYINTRAQLFAKIVKPIEMLMDSLDREKAVLSTLRVNERASIARPVTTFLIEFRYESDDEEEVNQCTRRTIVTKQAGGSRSLRSFNNLSRKHTAMVAVASLDALRRIHSLGILHGDIHRGNIIIPDSFKPADKANSIKIKLIDFGRARVFINSWGWHELPSYVSPPYGLNPNIMSPFELEHFAQTRRDDLFRLAETLYRVQRAAIRKSDERCDLRRRRFDLNSQLAKEKRTWILESDSPFPDLEEFFHDMAQLEFADRPDYERWIEQFEQAIERYKDDEPLIN